MFFKKKETPLVEGHSVYRSLERTIIKTKDGMFMLLVPADVLDKHIVFKSAQTDWRRPRSK